MSWNGPKFSRGQSRGAAHPAFVIVSGILLVSAIAFNGFVWNLKLHFKKDSVAQPREFRELPPVMGRWLQVSQDDKLDKETEDVLGTESYIYRDYIEVDRAGADLVAMMATKAGPASAATQPSLPEAAAQHAAEAATTKFNSASFDQQVRMINDALQGKTPGERKSIVSALEVKNHWGDVIHLGLTYYTGLVDTVAHIPDRCYIADGYEPSSYTVPVWQLGTDASGKPFSQSVRFISFQDSTGNNRVSKCVAYVFHTNGHYESDPLGVRTTLEDLTERYGYYAKIELMTLVPNIEDTDISNASAAMADFLTAARPQIETCFPDWTKVKHSHP
ncbi:MAG: hypothetical protein ABSH08_00090 [Tepidisphaeraceae bacterium]|jgi:hypothetical protein